MDPSTGTFSLHVLYDSMLNQPVENYGKPDPQFKPDENAQLVEGTNPGTHILWRDLHKKPLVTRAGVCPYCTALLWIARRAIERAKKSGRPLVPLAITENDWSIMFSCLLEAPQDTLVMKRWLATQ